MQMFEATLADREREHAREFHRAGDRRSFVVARGLLRLVLGAEVGTPPEQLELVPGRWGKPRLASGGPEFSVSHSGDAILIAVSPIVPVGVDIERLEQRVSIDWRKVAAGTLSRGENRTLEAIDRVDAARARRAFFECWTLKEAYTKGRGEGLHRPFSEFEVHFGTGAEPRLLTDWADPEAASHWTLRRLSVGTTFAAALAVQHTDIVVRRRRIPELSAGSRAARAQCTSFV